jgi:hypothetical protein
MAKPSNLVGLAADESVGFASPAIIDGVGGVEEGIVGSDDGAGAGVV